MSAFPYFYLLEQTDRSPYFLVKMYENKLFSLLSRLSPREMTAFQKHLTKHFTRQDIPTIVFIYVRKFYPGFRKTNVNPAAVHEQLFASEPDNRNKVLNAYSEIYQQLRDFLLLERVKKGPFDSRYIWMSILKERGLERAAEQEAALLRSEVQALPKKEVTDYLKSIEAYYYFNYLTDQDRRKADIEGLQQYVDNLDTYYAVCRLKVACEMLNLNKQRGQQFSLSALPLLLDMIIHAPQTAHPLLLCYRAVYQLLDTQEEQYFARVEALLAVHIKQIDLLELHTIVSYLHNYATPRIRDGAREFRARVHRVNIMALQHDVFSRKGAMSPSQFNNIVHVACSLKEFDWVELFILKQRPFLEDDIRDVTVELAKATFYFEQKYFNQVLTCLESAQFRDEHHVIRASLLTIMVYYEMNPEHPLIGTACTNFEQYLYKIRSRMAAPAESSLRFIRTFRLLLKSESSRAAILEAINQPGQLASRDWLLEKTNQYNPKFAAR